MVMILNQFYKVIIARCVMIITISFGCVADIMQSKTNDNSPINKNVIVYNACYYHETLLNSP